MFNYLAPPRQFEVVSLDHCWWLYFKFVAWQIIWCWPVLQQIPRCPHCGPDVKWGVMKPDIVFFGESLPERFHRQMAADKDVCDLLIVIGSSLKVRPVALIPSKFFHWPVSFFYCVCDFAWKSVMQCRCRCRNEGPPWWEPWGYQRFPRLKPVVGQTIVLHAVPPDRASTNPVSAFQIHSTFFSPKLLILNSGMCRKHGTRLLLVVAIVIHFVHSDIYDPLQLTGCKVKYLSVQLVWKCGWLYLWLVLSWPWMKHFCLFFVLYTLLSLSGNFGRLSWVRLQQPQEQRT